MQRATIMGFLNSVTACIRRQEGFCCVQYQVCANVINAFSLSSKSQATAGAGDVDSKCLLDYVNIPGKEIIAVLWDKAILERTSQLNA